MESPLRLLFIMCLAGSLYLEPTVVPPILLDLCSVAILHRFASPAWWEHIAQHVSAQLSADEAFNHVVTLQVRSSLLDYI